jgi:broad specificity phosphatase PhoE
MSSQKHSQQSNGETEVDLKKEIETQVEDLFKADRNDFDFKEEEPESIDDLADQLFDALYEHTNVV